MTDYTANIANCEAAALEAQRIVDDIDKNGLRYWESVGSRPQTDVTKTYRSQQAGIVLQMTGLAEVYRRLSDDHNWPSTLSDADVRRAYLETDGVPGNPLADALSAEIERRNLDI